MKLEFSEMDCTTSLLAATAVTLSALWVYNNQLKTWRQPFIRDVVSLISTVLSKLTYHPTKSPYSTDFGLLTIGGMPYIKNSWASPVGNTLLDKLTTSTPKYGLIASMVQAHEQAGTGINFFGPPQPVQPAFWQSHNVEHRNYPMQDLSTDICNEVALNCIEEMNQCIKYGQRVYLHCQAGRGRSFMMLMSYLLIYGEPQLSQGTADMPVEHRRFDTFEEALDHVQSRRPHVAISPARRAKIEAIVAAHEAQSTLGGLEQLLQANAMHS